MVLTGGITDWKSLSGIDYPLPESIGIVLGRQNNITRIFAGIGLFGLLASFNGIIISYSRQLFALSRSRYLPEGLSKLSRKHQTPDRALIAGGLLGIVALCLGRTDQLVILSVLGAIVMYILSMVALFILRKKEPNLARPFKVPGYPWVPLLALLLSVLSLIAIIYYNVWLSLLFFAGMGLTLIVFLLAGKHKQTQEDITLYQLPS
jgi:ethanolamine permease